MPGDVDGPHGRLGAVSTNARWAAAVAISVALAGVVYVLGAPPGFSVAVALAVAVLGVGGLVVEIILGASGHGAGWPGSPFGR
jgi:hypothetical protein